MVSGNTLRRILGLAAFACLVIVPSVMPGYMVFQASIILSYAIAILGLNLLMGFNGQISLAQGVFFAVGAYAAAILVADYGAPIWLAIPMAVVLNGVLGALVGIPALRLQGLQLAIVTIVLAALVPSAIIKFEWLTSGTKGIFISNPRPPAWLPISQDALLYYICLAGAGICVLVVLPLVRGETGRRLMAVRDNALIAESFGVDIARTRIAAFATSAAFGGLAGALFAMVNAFVGADSFQLFKSFEFLIGAIVGGITSLPGAFVGAAVVVLLPEYASRVSLALSGIIYSIVLITMMLVARDGVMGLAARIVSRLASRNDAGGASAAGSIRRRQPLESTKIQ